MSEQEMMTEIQNLRNEVATLRKANNQQFREQAKDALIEHYRLDEGYEFHLDYAVSKVDVTEGDTLNSVIEKADTILKEVCRKSGKEVPMTPTEEVQNYIEKVKRQQADDAAYAEEMKKSFL